MLTSCLSPQEQKLNENRESLFVCLKDPALGLSSYKPQQTFTSQTILKAKNKQKMIRFFKISTAFINVTSKRIVTH